MASMERFLAEVLRLKVNREKSAVDRPWKRKFLGFTFTTHYQPKVRVSPKSLKRFKDKIRDEFRKGRGRNLGAFIKELGPILRGWMAYYRKAEVKAAFDELDQWIRRKLRCILWRQWKWPKTRCRELVARGLDPDRAKKATDTGRGAWWNAGASHMGHAVPNSYVTAQGLRPRGPAGLPPRPLSQLSFVAAAPKPWADGLCPLYPPTAARRPPHRMRSGAP
jgi:RNA-directed DNA polymerase